MNILFQILIITIATILLGTFLPWWSILILPLFIGFSATHRPFLHFICGFVGVAMAWALLALISWQGTGAEIASRIGELFGGISSILLVVISTIFGGLVGGMAQLSSHFLRQIVQNS